jgi:hypothetical protein
MILESVRGESDEDSSGSDESYANMKSKDNN